MKKSIRINKTGLLFLLILLLITINFFKEKTVPPADNSGTETIEQAFINHKSDLQVMGSGTVIKLLRDDTKGIKHQKFIVRISRKLTVLIAHNIDLAPRINDISVGEKLSFYGEYEWNNRGGIVHWTHRDPGKRHIDGWLKFRGKIYQ